MRALVTHLSCLFQPSPISSQFSLTLTSIYTHYHQLIPVFSCQPDLPQLNINSLSLVLTLTEIFSYAPRLLTDPLFSIFLSIPVSSLICSLQESSSSGVLFLVPTCTEIFPTVPNLLYLLRFCTPSLSLQSNTSLSFPPSLYFIPYTSLLQTTSTGVYWISTTILGPHS